MNTNIKSIPAVKDVFFIRDFSLVKVMVLKEKFLDQMPDVQDRIKEQDNWAIVGRAGHRVIIEIDGHLYQQHITDHSEWLSVRTGDGKTDSIREANKLIYEQYPQLFTE